MEITNMSIHTIGETQMIELEYNCEECAAEYVIICDDLEIEARHCPYCGHYEAE
tara:strand:- start:1131 stop:1292 length:162 start_codon:yes stop_codon:yes gene_type:complete